MCQWELDLQLLLAKECLMAEKLASEQWQFELQIQEY